MQPVIIFSFLVLYWSSLAAQDTLAPAKIAKTQLPVTIKYRGTFHYAWKWNDKIGENWLITSTVKPYRPDKFVQNDDEKTAELHAYHFVKNDKGYKLVWSLSDAVKNCPFDITPEFIDSAFKFTDLDNDGIAESKLQYKIVCTSDVSPSGMKLVMHEHAAKYALRGFMWLPQGPEHKLDVTVDNANLEKLPKPKEEWEQYSQLAGRYQSEVDFKNAPPVFLEYARKEWLRYVQQSFE